MAKNSPKALHREALVIRKKVFSADHAKVAECYSAVIDNRPDPLYTASVQWSAVVSLLTLVVVLVLLFRSRRTPAPA